MNVSNNKKSMLQVDDSIRDFTGTFLLTFSDWVDRTTKTLRESGTTSDNWFGHLLESLPKEAARIIKEHLEVIHYTKRYMADELTGATHQSGKTGQHGRKYQL